MFTTRPEIAGTFGVVASTHWIASQVGMAVLERGGNAFDAAAATAFTLQVAEPHLNGPGGDAPIILHSARTQHAARDLRPGRRAATRDARAFRGARPRPDPGTGLLPAVVPGAFDAWCLTAARLGHVGAGRRAGLRHRLRAERHPHRAAHQRHDRERAAAVRGGVADAAPRCSCRDGEAPAPGSAVRAPGARRRPMSGICREAVGRHARGADRCGAAAPGTAASSPRRSDSFFRGTDGAGRLRPPPSRAADGRRLGALGGDGRGPGRATTTTATPC